MKLIKLDLDFSICKVKDISLIDFTREFVFLSKTDDEISLVCETNPVPENATEINDNWKALKIYGVLDFSLTGIIADISNILALAGIGIFVISTFNTDYILLKKDQIEKAIVELEKRGYESFGGEKNE